MNAAEAKSMSIGFKEPREEVVRAVRDLYDQAIKRAAENREWAIYHHQVGKLRTPISPVEMEMVVQGLRQDGFRVNESTVGWSEC